MPWCSIGQCIHPGHRCWAGSWTHRSQWSCTNRPPARSTADDTLEPTQEEKEHDQWITDDVYFDFCHLVGKAEALKETIDGRNWSVGHLLWGLDHFTAVPARYPWYRKKKTIVQRCSCAALRLVAELFPKAENKSCSRNGSFLVCTTHLLKRNEGMNVGKLWPADRLHFGGCIQLHRAGAKRNHTIGQRHIFVFQVLHVPHLAWEREMAGENMCNDSVKYTHYVLFATIRTSSTSK